MTDETFDPSFQLDPAELREAVAALSGKWAAGDPVAADLLAGDLHLPLPLELPQTGVGDRAALQQLAPLALGGACRLDRPDMLAHMDPPTPWVTWALTLWNARLNQNLLHPTTGPFGRTAEERVVRWLAPEFGMTGGHMTPGSTLANLTALWAARDGAGARRVIASSSAHLSVRKAAQILGMRFEEVATDNRHRLDTAQLGDLTDACLVLTAGTTAVGAIDPFNESLRAAWTHVDAAWAGPLRLSERHRHRLAGIERADSIAVSAHKWLFQPKESALILFRECERANAVLSFQGGYLAAPNVGLLGSHGAVAIPLLGTLLAWGRSGLAERIERCMENAQRLADAIEASSRFELFAPMACGIVVFRAKEAAVQQRIIAQLVPATFSVTRIGQDSWIRSVSANPLADIGRILQRLGL